nr:extracellular solute-binding protein [uncultured Eisenbergiella sp.]
MKRKLTASILAAALAVSTILAGCGGAADGGESKAAQSQEAGAEAQGGETDSAESGPAKTTAQADTGEVPGELTIYTYYADSAIAQVDRALEIMKETYPDLKINIEHRTDSDGSVLKTRAAVGELPDIFECTGQLTDILIKSGDLAELDSVIEETGFFDKYLEGNFDVKKSADGHFYAISSTVPECCEVFYNKEVFERLGLSAPQNYEEFKAVVEALNADGIIPLALFAQQKWPGLQMFDMAVVGEGQSLGLTGLEDGSTKIRIRNIWKRPKS